MYDFKLLNTEQRGEVFNLTLAFQIRAVSQVSCHAASSAALATKSCPVAAGRALLDFIITCFTAGLAPGRLLLKGRIQKYTMTGIVEKRYNQNSS